MVEVIENVRGGEVSIYNQDGEEPVTHTNETKIDEMYVEDGVLNIAVEVNDDSENEFVGLRIPLLAGQSYKDFLMSLPDIRIPEEG